MWAIWKLIQASVLGLSVSSLHPKARNKANLPGAPCATAAAVTTRRLHQVVLQNQPAPILEDLPAQGTFYRNICGRGILLSPKTDIMSFQQWSQSQGEAICYQFPSLSLTSNANKQLHFCIRLSQTGCLKDFSLCMFLISFIFRLLSSEVLFKPIVILIKTGLPYLHE